ncbi:MAG: DUF1800 family protein [Anaerolineae bacterium]|nr:DUF1800 family protein [Anaerolineae bacterium]
MNRRDFLKGLGIGAVALVAVNAGAIEQALSAAPAGAFQPAVTATRDDVAHVIARLSFGVTPDLYAHVRQIGAKAFIEEQLSPDNLTDADMTNRLQTYMPILSQNGGVLAQSENKMRKVIAGALIGSTTTRALYSEKQLYERMVQLFSDHFSLYIGKGNVVFLKVDDDRDTIRPNAMTTFRTILGASAHSPAMLVYLDNAKSEKSHPNENYARELMELHTLSVNGGYTETDVKEVARAFTGWSIVGGKQSQNGETVFKFRKMLHDTGSKVVLGTTIPNNGEADGDKVLDILAANPSTAKFVSTKMLRKFVSDNPADALVQSCADAYLSSNGDIRTVLRTIFNSDDFWNAPPKFKQPFEYSVSVLRALDYDVQDDTAFVRSMTTPLTSMGNIPFDWPSPNGYPDVGAYWMNNLLPRWNFAISAANNKIKGAQAGFDSLNKLLQANNIAADSSAALAFFGQYLFGRPLTDAEHETVLKFADATPGDEQTQIHAGVALLLASPAYQYK